MTIFNNIEPIQKKPRKRIGDIEYFTDEESDDEIIIEKKKVKKKNKRSNEIKKSSHATSSTYSGNSKESPMIIDSDDDSSGSQSNASSSKLKHSPIIGTIASVRDGVKNNVIHRPCQILLPVPLSKSQQTAYIRVKGENLTKVKDRLLNIINVPDQQGTNETGKIVMISKLLAGLRNHNLTLGIAVPQGPIMNGIIRNFNKNKFNYYILNETNKKSKKSDDKLLCIMFTTLSSVMPKFDLVIAYDTTFNQKDNLFKTNENIPIIRLVTKNTVEHALIYEILQNQDNSSFSKFQMERIVNFGLNTLDKEKGEFEVGCELSKFDIQGTCDKVFQWIDEGMSKNLTFGMEDAVEEVVNPPMTRPIKIKAEKRVSEVSDEGNLKRRKDKDLTQNEDDNCQKKKKLKVTKEMIKDICDSFKESLTSTTLTSPIISSPTIEQINLNKSKQIQSPKNSRDDTFRDSHRSSLKDSFRDSLQGTSSSKNSMDSDSNKNDSNRDLNKEQSTENNAIELKQKCTECTELLTQIENLTQEKDKYIAELSKKRRSKLSYENRNNEEDRMKMEITSIRMEYRSELENKDQVIQKLQDEIKRLKNGKLKSDAENKSRKGKKSQPDEMELENSKLKLDVENKVQEIDKIRKEMNELKSDVKNKDLEINKILKEMNELKSDAKDKDQEIESQRKKMEKLKSDVKDKDQEIIGILKEMNGLKSDADNKDQKISLQLGELDKLRKKMDKLKSDADDKDKKIEAQLGELDIIRKKMDKLKSDARKEIETQLEELVRIRKEMDVLKSDSDNKDHVILKLRNEKETQLGELNKTRKEMDGLKSDADNKNREIGKLRNEKETQLGELNKIRMEMDRIKLDADNKNREIDELKKEKEFQLGELNKIRMEVTRLKLDAGNKDREIDELRKVKETKLDELDKMQRIKSIAVNQDREIQMLREEIKRFEDENRIFIDQIAQLNSNNKSSMGNETLEDQVQILKEKIKTLQLRCDLQDKDLKLAQDDNKYIQDIMELLLQIKGKTKEEMDEVYLAKRNSLQPKSPSLNTSPSACEKLSNEESIAPPIQNVSSISNADRDKTSSFEYSPPSTSASLNTTSPFSRSLDNFNGQRVDLASRNVAKCSEDNRIKHI